MPVRSQRAEILDLLSLVTISGQNGQLSIDYLTFDNLVVIQCLHRAARSSRFQKIGCISLPHSDHGQRRRQGGQGQEDHPHRPVQVGFQRAEQSQKRFGEIERLAFPGPAIFIPVLVQLRFNS